MKFIYCKSKWEAGHLPLENFLERSREAGFDGTELYLPALSEAPEEINDLLRQYDLKLIVQLVTFGATPDAHLKSLEERFLQAVSYQPLRINAHSGRDIFSFEDNLRLYRRSLELSAEYGIPCLHETHRARPTYSAIDTCRYLEALPDLRLTADFSHWMVVHESDLRDQEERLRFVISRCDHIHARVGYEQGPQVPDPRAPEWYEHLVNHLKLWQAIVDSHKERGSAFLTITPEFGPPGYMQTIPYTREPLADTWSVNVAMKLLLSSNLNIDS